VFTFKYPVVDLKDFTEAFAKEMGAKMINNRFLVPSSIGNGYVQLVDLPNRLSAFIMNFTLHVDMHYEQSKSEQHWYSLRFEESEVNQSLITQIDGEFIKDSRPAHNSVYLVCSFFDLGYFFSKGTHIKCITIQMDKEWLAKYLRMDVYDEIVQEYLALKTASLHMEPMDVEYKRIMAEIINVHEDHPTHYTFIQNRIMALVERFFSNLYEKRYQFKYQVNASTHDIEQIRKVEQAITQDLTEPCPTIGELARMVSMSPSKLKQLFRDVYGKPVYQYYQFYRMQKAKAMLLSKKFSIKEVGLSLGYANLSNFSSAFRKEFNILPSELLVAS
jgi:AraC-like DNA-binding protein